MREENAKALKRIFEDDEEEEKEKKKIPPEQKKEKESAKDIKPLSSTTMEALQRATAKIINNGEDQDMVLNDLSLPVPCWLDDEAERDALEAEGWLQDL